MPSPAATEEMGRAGLGWEFPNPACVPHPGGTGPTPAALTHHPTVVAALHQGRAEPLPARYTSPRHRLAAGKKQSGFLSALPG